MVRLEDGFLGNASLFKYGRDLGHSAETSTKSQSGKTPWLSMVMISCSVSTFRKSRSPFGGIDAIRAACGMQETREEGTAATNKYLGLGSWKK